MRRALLISDDIELELSVVESENPTRNNQVTDNPVEQGVNIVDHVKPEALTLSLTGAVIGDNAGQSYQILCGFRDKSTLLTYSGRNVMANMVINDLSTSHDKDIRNGFKFTLNLKQVRVAELKFVDLSKVPIPARPKKNKGKQAKQTKKSGSKEPSKSGQYVNDLLNGVSINKTGYT